MNTEWLLIVSALFEFVRLDVTARRSFAKLRDMVANQRVAAPAALDANELELVVNAVHRACALYIWPAKCLLRSAAVTRMLRRRGIDAALVIGCQQVPLRSHAWVEVGGLVVSDDIKGHLNSYHVIDRW